MVITQNSAMRSLFYFAVYIIILTCSCSVAKTGADLQRLANKGAARTISIKKDIDLKGEFLSLPKGSTLKFKGGSISNGKIVLKSTRLKGTPSFKNCTFSGSVIIKEIDDRNFISSDDDGTLKFLLSNAIANGAKCVFNRDYRINMNVAPGTGLVTFNDHVSKTDIDFQGHTIYNTTPFPTPRIQSVIALRNVKDVTIRNCNFHDSDGHNSRLFQKSKGCVFVYCYGDCEQINLLDCSQENGDCIMRSGIFAHNEKHPENTPTVGLTNSTIRVKGLNVGYGLALYCGDNLDIDIDVANPHRGFYCTGVSNSRIVYKGYNPIETKCHILIKDAVYKRSIRDGSYVLDMKGCHDLVIKAIVKEVLPNESIISFQSYGTGKSEGADFTFRSDVCHHYDIDFTAEIARSPETGYYFISRYLPDNGTQGEGDMYVCKVSGIRIHDVKCLRGKARPYMCHVAKGFDTDITVEDCTVTPYNTDKNYGFDYEVKGNSTGTIHIKNSLMGNVLVRDKKVGIFDVKVEGTAVTRSVNYINDKSVRSLVRLRQYTVE